MLFYLLYHLPIWKGMTNGKRIARIMLIALVLYILLFAYSFEHKNDNFLFKVISGYFVYFLIADFVVNAVLYKLYYGRSILKEFKSYETDYFDEKKHKYYPKPENEIDFDAALEKIYPSNSLDNMNLNNNQEILYTQ